MINTYDLHKYTDLKCTNCRKKAEILVVFPTGVSEERCLQCTGMSTRGKRK
jgi:hypothetical protein